MKRRLKIAGQVKYPNGQQFVELVAERYGMPEEEASALITSVWSAKQPTMAYLYAQQAINDPALTDLIPTIITVAEANCWKLYKSIVTDVQHLEVDDDELGYLSEIAYFLESDYQSDEQEALLATRFESIVQTYDSLARELQIARAAAMQAGYADRREAIKVTLSEDAYTYHVNTVLDNLQAYTGYSDTVEQPNPAIRLPAETELTLRRMGIGDAIMVAAMHAFDPRWTEASQYNRVIYQNYMAFMGLDPSKRLSGFDDFFPPPDEVLSLIIDYSVYSLDVEGVIDYLTKRYTNLSKIEQRRRNGRFDQLRISGHLTDEKAYELCVAAATFALNRYSNAERRKSGIPSFENYLIERRNLVGKQRLVIDANSKAQNIARRDGSRDTFGHAREPSTPPIIAGHTSGRTQLREGEPRLPPPSSASGIEADTGIGNGPDQGTD